MKHNSIEACIFQMKNLFIQTEEILSIVFVLYIHLAIQKTDLYYPDILLNYESNYCSFIVLHFGLHIQLYKLSGTPESKCEK